MTCGFFVGQDRLVSWGRVTESGTTVGGDSRAEVGSGERLRAQANSWPFPLPPTLSRWEREHRLPRLLESGASQLFDERTSFLPLPAGEGRGEGERSKHAVTAASFPTHSHSIFASTAPALRLFCLFAICVGALLVPAANAQSWAERARQMNRTEISATEAVKRSEQGEADRRNKIRIRKIQPAMPSVDWNTDPTAVPYMLYQIGKRTDLPVHIENEGLNTGKDDIFQETVLYLTSHYRWGFNEKENANLTLFLKRGGTLFLDDCYNRGSPFAESVRPEVAKMIVGAEPRVLAQDDVLVKDCFKMIYPTPWPGAAEFENRAWLYFPLDNRPAIFFSPNDDGCGWEISTPPSASNPIGEGIGHGGDNRQRETMYQWMSNWVLFVYTH